MNKGDYVKTLQTVPTIAFICEVSGFGIRDGPVGGGCPVKVGTRPQLGRRHWTWRAANSEPESLPECFMFPFNVRKELQTTESWTISNSLNYI